LVKFKNKKMKKIILIGSLAFSALIVGCEDEEITKVNSTNDKTTLLTSLPWRLESMTYSSSVNPTQSVGGAVEDCMKDDRFKFNTDGKAVRSKGSSLCSDDESKDDETVFWKFGVNQETLDIRESLNDQYESQRIVLLDANSLVIESVNKVSDSLTVKANIKYVH
jgi:hypothetical protein